MCHLIIFCISFSDQSLTLSLELKSILAVIRINGPMTFDYVSKKVYLKFSDSKLLTDVYVINGEKVYHFKAQ
jgi:hypothetical protein